MDNTINTVDTFVALNPLLAAMIFLAVIVVLVLIKKSIQDFGSFKKVKLGIGPVGVETESKDSEEITRAIKACSDEKEQALGDVWRRIDELQCTDKDILSALEQINGSLTDIKTDLRTAFKKISELNIDQFKLLFYTKDVPLAERMIAGLKYVASGYNHQFKKDVLAMVDDYEDIYNAVIAVDKKLKLSKTTITKYRRANRGQDTGI